jgi:hypothetical protein
MDELENQVPEPVKEARHNRPHTIRSFCFGTWEAGKTESRCVGAGAGRQRGDCLMSEYWVFY